MAQLVAHFHWERCAVSLSLSPRPYFALPCNLLRIAQPAFAEAIADDINLIGQIDLIIFDPIIYIKKLPRTITVKSVCKRQQMGQEANA